MPAKNPQPKEILAKRSGKLSLPDWFALQNFGNRQNPASLPYFNFLNGILFNDSFMTICRGADAADVSSQDRNLPTTQTDPYHDGLFNLVFK